MNSPHPKVNKEDVKICCLLGCFKSVKKNSSYCSMHIARLTRTGSFQKKTPFDRLMGRIEKNVFGCWNYTAYKNADGYGRMRANGKKVLAHRFSYENKFGSIPSGLLVCHKCDNPSCVNPDHLFLGTDLDNVRDSIKKNRTHPVKRSKERWIKCPTFRKK